jgi:hypothetical protein
MQQVTLISIWIFFAPGRALVLLRRAGDRRGTRSGTQCALVPTFDFLVLEGWKFLISTFMF